MIFDDTVIEKACFLVEDYFRPLIGEQTLLVHGNQLFKMVEENDPRPHWRRVVLDIVDECTANINYLYAVHNMAESFTNPQNHGMLVLLEKDIWENEKKIQPLGYLICHETEIYEKKVQVLSLICSKRACIESPQMKNQILEKRKGFGNYLMAVYLIAVKLMKIYDGVVLEVLPLYDVESNHYGSGTPLNYHLRQWYLSLGFVEDPSIALGKDHEPMVRGIIKNHAEVNLFNFGKSFNRTLVFNIRKQNHIPLKLKPLILAVTKQQPFTFSDSPFT